LNIPNNEWEVFIKNEMKKDYFIKIKDFIKKEKTHSNVYPVEKNIFNAFNLTTRSDIKVVIIGQDPYYKENQAHGLAFSVNDGIKIPPSLRNIYKELTTDINDFETRDILSAINYRASCF